MGPPDAAVLSFEGGFIMRLASEIPDFACKQAVSGFPLQRSMDACIEQPRNLILETPPSLPMPQRVSRSGILASGLYLLCI